MYYSDVKQVPINRHYIKAEDLFTSHHLFTAITLFLVMPLLQNLRYVLKSYLIFKILIFFCMRKILRHHFEKEVANFAEKKIK